jgi:hypothetical protein
VRRPRSSAAELVLAVALAVSVAGCSLPPASDGGTGAEGVVGSGAAGAASTRPAPTTSVTARPTTAPRPSSRPSFRPASGSALAALAHLAVKGRAPMTGYRRSQFGPSWPDVDGNGCDTRNDVLARDLVDITYRPGGCKVATGVLHDPYTGATIHFVRGVTTSVLVQIDHVVALADAWQKGAQRWSPERRKEFANDPLELLAVGASVNDAKGAGDAATWLPPRRSFRCAYVARQIAVTAKYGLWVTQAEKDAMGRVLSTCPAQPLPR